MADTTLAIPNKMFSLLHSNISTIIDHLGLQIRPKYEDVMEVFLLLTVTNYMGLTVTKHSEDVAPLNQGPIFKVIHCDGFLFIRLASFMSGS